MTQPSAKTGGHQTPITQQICCVSDCSSPANRVAAKMCEKHYARQRRRGTTEKYKRKHIIKHSQGYLLVAADDHPLMRGRPSGSRVYQHRIVFHDAHGGGSHECNWCGVSVDFPDMHVDHLNAIRSDNRIENLVASCPRCNMDRGFEKMKQTMQARGINIEHNGVTKHISEWASDIGITVQSLSARLKSGWSTQDALTKPRGKTGPKKAKHD